MRNFQVLVCYATQIKGEIELLKTRIISMLLAKAILDTPNLSADGALTDDSEAVSEKVIQRLTD